MYTLLGKKYYYPLFILPYFVSSFLYQFNTYDVHCCHEVNRASEQKGGIFNKGKEARHAMIHGERKTVITESQARNVHGQKFSTNICTDAGKVHLFPYSL